MLYIGIGIGIYHRGRRITVAAESQSAGGRLLAADDRPGVLDEVVDEDRPGALLIVVAEVVVHGSCEVKKKVPGVLNTINTFNIINRIAS